MVKPSALLYIAGPYVHDYYNPCQRTCNTTGVYGVWRKENIMNKDKGALGLSDVTTTDTVILDLPKEVTRNYPTKFIPPGTRFIVSYSNGDITKPVITGREF